MKLQLPKRCYNDHRGYITLVSVLVISAVGVSVVLSLIVLSIGSSRTSFALEQSAQAKMFANACAEEALQQVRDLSSYTGSGSISYGLGACTYDVTDLGGEDRLITSSGTVDTIVRKVSIEIDSIDPQINVTTWQEVADL